VEPYFTTLLGQQRAVVGERGTDLRGEGVANTFLTASDSGGLAMRVPEAQPHSGAVGRSVGEHHGDLRVGLGEEGAGEDENVDVLAGFP